MEGLKAALAVSAGLHLAVAVALSVAPIRPEPPPPGGIAVVPVEIVSAGPPQPAGGEAAPADPASPVADTKPVQQARAQSAASETFDASSEAAGPEVRQAPEAPPLPTPKPDRPQARPERVAEAPAPLRSAANPSPAPRPVEAEAVSPPSPASEEALDSIGARLPSGGHESASGPVPALSRTEEKRAGATSAQSTGAGSTGAGADGSSAAAESDVLAAYFARLQRWLEKHKRYPRTAQVRRQEGTGMLRFTMDRNGRVLSHRLDRGTGHGILDREIEAMLERAQPLPPMPQDLPQRVLDLAIPVSFRLH